MAGDLILSGSDDRKLAVTRWSDRNVIFLRSQPVTQNIIYMVKKKHDVAGVHAS